MNRRRGEPIPFMRSGGLAVVVVVASVVLAACSSSGHAVPTVASLPNADAATRAVSPTTSANSVSAGTKEGSATTQPKGNATVLLNEWATCMHGHGDPNQADPTVDAYGVIHVAIPSDAASLSNEVHAGADPCDRYLAAAEAALRAANPVAPPPDQAELIKYVNCMRANGVPNYPYPTGNTTNFNGTGVDPNSPQVQNVNNLCGSKLHLPGWWVSGNGPPGDVVVTSGGPNGNGPTPNPGQSVPSSHSGSGASPVQGASG